MEQTKYCAFTRENESGKNSPATQFPSEMPLLVYEKKMEKIGDVIVVLVTCTANYSGEGTRKKEF